MFDKEMLENYCNSLNNALDKYTDNNSYIKGFKDGCKDILELTPFCEKPVLSFRMLQSDIIFNIEFYKFILKNYGHICIFMFSENSLSRCILYALHTKEKQIHFNINREWLQNSVEETENKLQEMGFNFSCGLDDFNIRYLDCYLSWE